MRSVLPDTVGVEHGRCNMNKLVCYCGHDCARCLTYIATINNDEDLRKQSQNFYKTEFGIDIPLKDIQCLGGRSNDVFYLC